MRWSEDELATWMKRHGVEGRARRVDTSNPPFALPPDIVLDLPPPISVNRIWRKTKSGMIKSTAYNRWKANADAMLMELDQMRGVKPIVGKFSASIVCKRSNLDLDNNSKCVLDFLESRQFILNDKFCEKLELSWGDAPTGCRVTVRPWA